LVGIFNIASLDKLLICVRIILKWNTNKYDVRVWTGFKRSKVIANDGCLRI
jgi:hypothetical protein